MTGISGRLVPLNLSLNDTGVFNLIVAKKGLSQHFRKRFEIFTFCNSLDGRAI